ncbi:MAG TPA: hypothetical protein VEC12_09420 [Bacteroidia bacterium]|nr:hypothetical protein [Bacteroidia bacterium]
MGLFLTHIKILAIAILAMLQPVPSAGQQTIAFDINTPNTYKRLFLFNTQLPADSVELKNTAGKSLPSEYITPMEYAHVYAPEIILFEAEGSLFCIDTAGNFYLRDTEKPDSKPVSLGICIDTLNLGMKDIILECSEKDMENLVVYAVPLSKYKVAGTEPQVSTKLTFNIEEIVYTAKGKVPPTLLASWKDKITFDPENRKVMYEFKINMPRDMVRRGSVTLIIYDLSNQVVAIYPDIKKTTTALKRENIMSATYIYKVFFNGDEEVKKGLIHFMSPDEDERKGNTAGEQTNKVD